jgi:hypothetical protein
MPREFDWFHSVIAILSLPFSRLAHEYNRVDMMREVYFEGRGIYPKDIYAICMFTLYSAKPNEALTKP